MPGVGWSQLRSPCPPCNRTLRALCTEPLPGPFSSGKPMREAIPKTPCLADLQREAASRARSGHRHRPSTCADGLGAAVDTQGAPRAISEGGVHGGPSGRDVLPLPPERAAFLLENKALTFCRFQVNSHTLNCLLKWRHHEGG